MLATYANNAFMILVRNMERYGGWHFLFYEVQAVLGSIILSPANVDVEVVFIEAVKDDLNVA